MTFESLSEVGHSEQWEVSGIQELKRKNPYHLKVIPFEGDSNTFELQGQKIETRDYQALADRIAEGRVNRSRRA